MVHNRNKFCCWIIKSMRRIRKYKDTGCRRWETVRRSGNSFPAVIGRAAYLSVSLDDTAIREASSKLSVLQSLTEELGDLEMQWSVTDISLDISISIFPSASTFQFCCNHLHSSCPHQMITTSFCEIALGSLLPGNLNCAKTYHPDLIWCHDCQPS